MSGQIIQTSFGNTVIEYGKGLEYLPNLTGERRTVIVTDQKIYDIYSNELSGYEVVIVPEGEQAKTLKSISKASHHLLELGLDRSALLVGFGGGCITDFVGFLASIYKRGISFGFIPTTVLAQVDASIGGKNGVNLGQLKNMLGVFAAPEFILVDAKYNLSLEHEEFIQGFAEVIKHAFIKDRELLEYLSEDVEKLVNRDLDILNSCIRNAAQIKIQIAEQDSKELGERKKLNFGHTIGHSIEHLLKIPHGDAVSIGMTEALRISNFVGLISDEDVSRGIRLIEAYGLPTRNIVGLESYWNLLIKDKKSVGFWKN
jgi:3-dehydroquinate synthase